MEVIGIGIVLGGVLFVRDFSCGQVKPSFKIILGLASKLSPKGLEIIREIPIKRLIKICRSFW